MPPLLILCRHCSSKPLLDSRHYHRRMHEAECLLKHGKTKDGSSTRSSDYLTMQQPAQGISDGMYTYKHYCEGGLYVHDIVVKKITFRILLYYIGTICLLMTVCHILLSKESLGLGSLWSIFFAGIIAKWLRCDPVKKESLVIMPTFGVQLEQHFWSGRVHRKFVPASKILKPVLNECVTPVTCYWSLALLLRDEYGLMLVFKNLNPPAKMLVPIWKALCAFVDSNTLSASVLPQLHDPHKHAEQAGGSVQS